MPNDERWERALEQSLSRVSNALARSESRPVAVTPTEEARSGWAKAFPVLAGTTGVLVAGAVIVHTGWLLIPAAVVGALAGESYVHRLWSWRKRNDAPGHIGPGADVAATARVERGGTVEAGVTVLDGTVVKSGAVVRWGATVGPNVTVEEDAIVHWGVTVCEGAIIERGASVGPGVTIGAGAIVGAGTHVGAGSDVLPGVHVESNARYLPGSTVRGDGIAQLGPGPVRTGPAQDPEEQRIESVCRRIETELASSPESIRTFLGRPQETTAMLRRTCLDLLRRERIVRAEASSEHLQRLDDEAAKLRERVERATDEPIKRSLQAAITAIESQRSQRAVLARNADRLEAERTRLVWTLEGIATQLVRMRSADLPVTGTIPAELETSVAQLRLEIDAVADALEATAFDAPAGDPSEPSPSGRSRERV